MLIGVRLPGCPVKRGCVGTCLNTERVDKGGYLPTVTGSRQPPMDVS